MIRVIASVLACALLLATQVRAADSFPRVGGYLISNPQNYWDASYQSDIATLDVAIISAYPGWGSGHNTTIEKTIQAIKARNSKTRVFLYVDAESIPTPVSSVWPGLASTLDSQRWWLYKQFGGSEKVLADTGVTNYILNVTPYSTKNASGQRFNQWFAQYMVTQLAKPAPSADGFFTDSVLWAPRRDGDWNQDGKTDSATDPTVRSWMRQGYVQYVDTLRAAMPGKTQIANIADWGAPEAVLTEYQGKFDGGVLEGMIGKSYSAEGRQGWAVMMARYRKTMASLAAPKLALFQMSGDPTDYQAMRYGLGSCLLDDGYFAFNNTATKYSGVYTFDEFKVDLGAATSSPPTTAWSSGVYRREFTNGIVLVNPRGNGARDVTLETDFKKIQGTQDPSVNNGATVRTVHLNDRDGVVLLRTAIVKQPEAPALSVQ